jgi:hypothetical protein
MYMRTKIVATSRIGAIEARRTIIYVVTFVGWVKEYVGNYDPAVIPKIAGWWEMSQSGLSPCGTEFEDLISAQGCAH